MIRELTKAIGAVCLVAASLNAHAQVQTPAPAKPQPVVKPKSTMKLAPKSHLRRVNPKLLKPAVQPAPPPPPPAPVMPDWPANDPPKSPTVSWNSTGLSIDAENASLKQILDEISTRTGLKVEGLNTDPRIFGTYGPAPARDVLMHLLDGLGYNVLLIGDQGAGTPRQMVLSTRKAAPANSGPMNMQAPQPPPQQAEENDTANDDMPQPEAPIRPHPEDQQPQQPPQQPNQQPAQNQQQHSFMLGSPDNLPH